jgi:elongation factor Ts
MAISAKDVAELRARTGAGMMDCKKALEEAHGDMDKAVELLRTRGIAKADKRGDRTASQGMIVIRSAPNGSDAAMIELNSETDFVAKNAEFIALAGELAKHALAHAPDGVHPGAAIESQPFGKGTVGDTVKEAAGKTGEALGLRRVAHFKAANGTVGHYIHHNHQSGAIVELEGARGEAVTELGKNLAKHVTATDPIGVSEADIPANLLATERRIAEEQVAQEGKPENLRSKIVEGKVRKFIAERTLMGQPFVQDESKTIAELVKDAEKVAGGKIVVKRLARFKVGEG